MTEKNTTNRKNLIEILKDSIIVVLILIFVLLYGASFTVKFDSLTDHPMLLQIELIIFILIGYYFGRLPSWQNEHSLKEEIARQTQKIDAAQHIKERALQERERLEERIKNARAVLQRDKQPQIALVILDS